MKRWMSQILGRYVAGDGSTAGDLTGEADKEGRVEQAWVEVA